jgi:hypothetical protein
VASSSSSSGSSNSTSNNACLHPHPHNSQVGARGLQHSLPVNPQQHSQGLSTNPQPSQGSNQHSQGSTLNPVSQGSTTTNSQGLSATPPQLPPPSSPQHKALRLQDTSNSQALFSKTLRRGTLSRGGT